MYWHLRATLIRMITRLALASGLLVGLVPCAFGQATTYTWNGAADSNFTNTANWTSGNAAVTNNAPDALNARISVQNGSSGKTLVYSADQGHTLYNSSGRSLFIGSGAAGSMTITGGTFESQAVTEDGMANGSTSSLTLDGGSYLNTTSGAKTFLVVYDGANAKGTLAINSGSFAVDTLKFGAGTTSAGTGIVQLNGGTLSVKSIVDSGGSVTSKFYFNGGTLKALDNSGTFLQGLDEVYLQAGGALIDTDTYSIGISQDLLDAGGGLTKSGTGLLVLRGNNTYSGATVVNAGTLQVATSTALGATTGGVTVASGARLELTGGVTVAEENITISGHGGDYAGALQSQGGDNTWAGTVTLGSSDARVGADGAGSVLRISGNIQDGAGNSIIVRNYQGTTVFCGTPKSYTGSTQVMDGVLQIDGGNNILPVGATLTLGANAVATLSGSLDLNGFNQQLSGLLAQGDAWRQTVTNTHATRATLTLNNTTTNTYAGQLTGNLALAKSGAGALVLSGANSYTGATQINSGIVQIAHATALGDASAGTTVSSGAHLELVGGITVAGENVTIYGFGSGSSYGALRSQSGDNTWAGTVTLGSGDTRVGADTAGSVLRISGDIVDGTGSAIVVRNNWGKTVFSGTPKTYTGRTQVMNGLLKIDGGDNILPVGTTLLLGTNLNGTLASTFDLNGFDQQVARLATEGDAWRQTVTNGSATAATLTVDTTTAGAYAGLLAGNLSLAKAGTGSLTLGGTNTMTGQLRILNGTLALTHASSNNLSQASGFSLEGPAAVLDVTGLADDRLVLAAEQTLSGAGTVRGNVTVGASATVAPDLLTIDGDYDQTGLLAIELAGDTQGTDYDWLQVTGSATLAGYLEVALSDDFMPHAGDAFQVLTASSITDRGLELVGDLASWFDYRIVSTASGDVLELYATATVPEPSTLLLALGLLATAGVFRLRRTGGSYEKREVVVPPGQTI